jgi:hypothetical protein
MRNVAGVCLIALFLLAIGCTQTEVHSKPSGGEGADAGDGGGDDTGRAGGEGDSGEAAGDAGSIDAYTDAYEDAAVDAAVDAASLLDGSCSCLEENECCDGCLPDNEGQPCEGAAVDCADNICSGGACIQQARAGFCLIDGVCFNDGETSPEEPCQYCDSVFSNNGWRNKPGSIECDDGLFCNGDDTCDDEGRCSVHTGDPCAGGSECNDQCDDDDDTCVSPQGTPCGDETDDECTAPDTCDSKGVCQPNHEAAGTSCGDDTDNECTDPDTCDSQGVCQPNDQPLGVFCGDDTDNECTDPDTCDGEGACQPNHAGTETTCFGDDLMIYSGKCNEDGVCAGNTYCDDNDCWKIPPTEQAKCYNNSVEISCSSCDSSGNPDFCGQDATYPYNSRAFESVSSGYLDTLTGLVWASSNEGSATMWSSCNSACGNKVVGDDADWRMPDVYEMEGIMRFNSCDTFSDLGGMSSGYYWTQTVDGDNSSNAWIVTPVIVCGPLTMSLAKTTDSGTCCRCVRGTNLSHKDTSGNRFFETGPVGEKAILDRGTGLIWQRSYLDESSEKTWNDALEYCEGSGYGGYDDWRLPNINELFSLVNMETSGIASEFPAMPALSFYSSTTSTGMLSVAWVVDFDTGITYYENKENFSAVRCVRGGP